MRKTILVSATVLLIVTVAFTLALARSNEGSAWIGVYCQTVDDDMAETFDLSVARGVIINDIVSGSPADEAGLEDGDVIISFDGEELFDHDDLLEMLEDSSPGNEVKVTVLRDSDRKDFQVTLEKARRSRRYLSDNDHESHYFMYNDDSRSHVYVGVKLSGLTRQLGDFFGVEKGRGALVTEVVEDSPAEESGIKAGDVIIAVDGERVLDGSDVAEVIEGGEEGDKTEITIIRDKKEQTIEVTLAEADDDWHGSHWYHSGYDGSTLGWDFPNIDVRIPRIPSIPRIRGLHHLDADNYDFNFENDELEEGLDELREELREMKRELKEELEQLKKD